MSSEEGFDSNYRYVLVAARRARQLLSGARPAIETATRKPCKIAQEEIKAGKVQWNQDAAKPPVEAAAEPVEPVVEPETSEDE